MQKRSFVIIGLLCAMLSCSSNTVLIEPENLETFDNNNDKEMKYILVTLENKKIEFNQFKIQSDTLIIFEPNFQGQFYNHTNLIKLSFSDIDRIILNESSGNTKINMLWVGGILLALVILYMKAMHDFYSGLS